VELQRLLEVLPWDMRDVLRHARRRRGLAIAVLSLAVATNHALVSAVHVPQSWVDDGWAPWERELTARQEPERVMDVIGLKPGMVVGEIGAQVGRFTVHLARRVGPAGRVFANDIDDRALADLRDRVKRYDVPNIEVVRGQVDDPRLPRSTLDLAIMVRTYHELAQPRALLENLKPSLKAGAPVVIVDLDTEKTRHSDAKSSTEEASVLSVARSAGYELVALHRFLPEDTIFVLRVAARPVAEPVAGLVSACRALRGPNRDAMLWRLGRH